MLRGSYISKNPTIDCNFTALPKVDLETERYS